MKLKTNILVRYVNLVLHVTTPSSWQDQSNCLEPGTKIIQQCNGNIVSALVWHRSQWSQLLQCFSWAELQTPHTFCCFIFIFILFSVLLHFLLVPWSDRVIKILTQLELTFTKSLHYINTMQCHAKSLNFSS